MKLSRHMPQDPARASETSVKHARTDRGSESGLTIARLVSERALPGFKAAATGMKKTGIRAGSTLAN